MGLGLLDVSSTPLFRQGSNGILQGFHVEAPHFVDACVNTNNGSVQITAGILGP